MASPVSICNRALQKLGAKRISSLTEGSSSANACNAVYESLRDGELSAHPWVFAIKRASLAADSTEPDWGRSNAFTLPPDFLDFAPPYPEDNSADRDWVVENGKIYTDEDAPLYIRYIFRETDTLKYHPLFVETLASAIAKELAEELTQSNSKKQAAIEDYEMAIRRARKRNAFQKTSAAFPEDSWITGRL
jgi:hypothetical protein